MTSSAHLRSTPKNDLVLFDGRSDVLAPTQVPYGADVRAHYLLRSQEMPSPIITSSEFVPRIMIEHLLRHKRDTAIGFKCVPGSQITNMEGAMHTYVTPIVLGFMHGDYSYRGLHAVLRFPSAAGKDQARKVVVSALVQPDFETTTVMLKLASLSQSPTLGNALPAGFKVPSLEEKQDAEKRRHYDETLRMHMVAHLVSSGSLPAEDVVSGKAISIDQAQTLIEKYITSSDPIAMAVLEGVYVTLPYERVVVSLELLFNSALHQMRNELSALEASCPQGYVYTFDPPAIFAKHLDASLLNRLQIAAVKLISQHNSLSKMRIFAFNDYADRSAIPLLKTALSSQPHVVVLPKAALFPGKHGFYQAPQRAEGALLVLHNNSDAFGQNIQTELSGGSMDGAIGANSSTAASLRRDRLDLLTHLI